MTRRLAGLTLLCALGLSQLAAECDSQQTEDVLGHVAIDGRPAVFAVLCDDDAVRGVRVYAAPAPDEDGDFVPLWEAEGPTTDAVRQGLVVLGDNSQFTTVRRQPPAEFPRRLSVSVDTVRGRIADEAWEPPAELPEYAAGTPASAMTFETVRGRKSYPELRKLFTDQPHACPR